MFALRFLAGAMLAAPGVQGVNSAAVLKGMVGGLGWLAATAFVYLGNGISDVGGDRVNGSHRPLAGGHLPVRTAVQVCKGLAITSVALAAIVSPTFVVCVLAMLALGWAYSFGPAPAKGKAWAASTVIAAGGWLTYLAGEAAIGGALSRNVVLTATMLGLWMGVAGNTKDLADAAGDATAGRRTLPVVFGSRAAAWLSATACLLVALISFPVLRSVAPIVSFVLMSAAIVMLVIVLSGHGTRSNRLYIVFMTSQMLANLLVASV